MYEYCTCAEASSGCDRYEMCTCAAPHHSPTLGQPFFSRLYLSTIYRISRWSSSLCTLGYFSPRTVLRTDPSGTIHNHLNCIPTSGAQQRRGTRTNERVYTATAMAWSTRGTQYEKKLTIPANVCRLAERHESTLVPQGFGACYAGKGSERRSMAQDGPNALPCPMSASRRVIGAGAPLRPLQESAD